MAEVSGRETSDPDRAWRRLLEHPRVSGLASREEPQAIVVQGRRLDEVRKFLAATSPV